MDSYQYAWISLKTLKGKPRLTSSKFLATLAGKTTFYKVGSVKLTEKIA